MSNSKKIQAIYSPVESVEYNLNGRFIPVEQLTDKQLRIGWYRTLEQAGHAATKVTHYENKAAECLKIMQAIGEVARERGLPMVGEPIEVDHVKASELLRHRSVSEPADGVLD